MSTSDPVTTNERHAESVDAVGNLGGSLHETLRGVARTTPLAWDSSTGAALVFRHRDVEALAHDPRVAGIGLHLFDMMGITSGPLREWYSGLMFTNEGVEHRRLRRLVARAFTPRSAEALRETAAELAAAVVACTPGQGSSVDLVERFALLPTRVMCRLLGVPDGDVATFGAWLDALSPIFGVMTPEQIDAATRAIVELRAYVTELAARRQADPGPDLIPIDRRRCEPRRTPRCLTASPRRRSAWNQLFRSSRAPRSSRCRSTATASRAVRW
jgi:cytochrome P450